MSIALISQQHKYSKQRSDRKNAYTKDEYLGTDRFNVILAT